MLGLTPEQKDLIREKGEDLKWDINVLTKIVFDNDDLDGRSKEGKLVKEFILNSVNATPKTRSVKSWEHQRFELTEKNKEFIENNIEHIESSIELAKAIFPEIETKYKGRQIRMCKEVKAVQRYIKENMDVSLLKYSKELIGPDNRFVPPRAISTTIPYVIKYTGTPIQESKLKEKDKRCLEALMRNLNNLRLLKTLESYNELTEQELFLNSFIRDVWDKPDLTASEVESYCDLADERVLLHNIKETENKIRGKMNESLDDDDKLSMSIVEILDKQIQNRDKCATRISKLQRALEGTREQRIKNQSPDNHNILTVIRALQEEESRLEMLRQLEIERNAVSDEIDRIESLPDYIGKLFGASKSELLY